MSELDEKHLQNVIVAKRDARVAERAAGAWGSITKLVDELDLRNRWLLYVATFISALLTGASIFIIIMGDSPDTWRMVFAGLMALIGVFICEPAVLWWLQRVEYHQNKMQLITAILGLIVSAGLSARTIWSAGELLVYALGDNVFSNYTSVSTATQDWLVHFIPYLVMTHVGLGLLYFATSAESASHRSIEKVKRSSNTRIHIAKADMDADVSEAMADAMTQLVIELAPQVGMRNAKRAINQYMLEQGFDADNNGAIDEKELAAFNKWITNSNNQRATTVGRSNNGAHPT